MAKDPARAGRRAFLLTGIALLWSLGLIVAAVTAPVYGSATLVQENGSRVLLVVSVPAAISLAVWIALRIKCSHGGRVGGFVAWVGIAVLAGFCLLALLSIGAFVVPVAVLLAWAASVTPSPSPA